MKLYELSKQTGIPVDQLKEELGHKSHLKVLTDEEVAKYTTTETEPAPEAAPVAAVAEKEKEPAPKKPKADPELPGYLARRQDKIKAEQAQLANGVGGAPITYGENAPGFLKRRFGGEA